MTAHAALHAAQANAHANKAEDTSPFSALLESTAPKADQAKPKDKSDSDDTRADDAKNTDTKNRDAKTAKADESDSRMDVKADAQADKSDKTAKSGKDVDKADARTDAAQAAADGPAPPVAAPPAPVAAAATPPPGDADSAIEAVAAAAPQAGKTAAAPDDGDLAADAATGAVAAQDIKGAATAAPGKTADATAAAPDEIKPDGAKTDGTKADKTDKADAKPDAPQPAVAADASAPKPTTNMAVHDITAPQAPSAPNAPSVTQHVQVAAQTPAPMPVPNMPALAIEISAKSQSGAKQFDIRLDPPELGRVEVRLSIDAAGKASAHLSADQPQTLDMLQKDSTSLMRALRDAGLNVSQDGLNFSLRQQGQNQQGGGARQSGGRGTARNFSLTATTSLEATATSAAYRRAANGRLDISV